jgi:hypothetical protein
MARLIVWLDSGWSAAIASSGLRRMKGQEGTKITYIFKRIFVPSRAVCMSYAFV